MKNLVFLIIPIALTMCTPGSSKKSEMQLRVDSLQRLMAQKDSAMYAVLGTFTSIESNLQSIKDKEKIISVTASQNENKQNREEKINGRYSVDIHMMQENRQKLQNLKKQLKKANVKNKETGKNHRKRSRQKLLKKMLKLCALPRNYWI
jgi:hypothetical protein